jgi:hypothetical protein
MGFTKWMSKESLWERIHTLSQIAISQQGRRAPYTRPLAKSAFRSASSAGRPSAPDTLHEVSSRLSIREFTVFKPSSVTASFDVTW